MKTLPFPLKYAVAGAIAVVALIFGIVYVSSLSSTKTDGVRKENALEARYRNTQNQLSNYVLTIREQLDIADRKADKLDQVLSDAVKGRYDGDLKATTPGQSSQLISALVEAYPDLSGLDSYDRLLDTISAGRAKFANAQTVLLDEISSYESWLDEGLWHSFMVRQAGFPSNRLEARVGDNVWKGSAALDKMKDIVLAREATDAYQTGDIDPIDLNPGE